MKTSDIAENPAILDAMVNKQIDSNDQMHSGNDDHYFGCGRDAIRKISTVVTLSGVGAPDNILDFASGYGRVARYLRAAFPDANMTVSDVMKPAVKFAAKQFSATAHVSSPGLDSVNIGEQFSLIWSGSLMTHLDEDQATRLLALFERHLADDGLAVFTTHGRFVANKWKTGSWPYQLTKERLIELSELFHNGQYAYSDYDHMKGYGISMTPLAWIMAMLDKFPTLRLVTLMERGWDDHQDLVALQKRPVLPMAEKKSA